MGRQPEGGPTKGEGRETVRLCRNRTGALIKGACRGSTSAFFWYIKQYSAFTVQVSLIRVVFLVVVVIGSQKYCLFWPNAAVVIIGAGWIIEEKREGNHGHLDA